MFRLILIISLLVTIPTGWLVYSHGRDKVIEELVQASQKNDVAAFGARIDWEAMRVFLKEDITKQKRSPIGAAMGPELTQIAPVVDYFIQPENIDILYYYHEEVFKDVPERDFIYATGFAPPFGFYVTVSMPKIATTDKDAAHLNSMRDNLKVRTVFRLDGLTWKAKEMHVPLFMVPRHAYPGTPALKVYGRTQR